MTIGLPPLKVLEKATVAAGGTSTAYNASSAYDAAIAYGGDPHQTTIRVPASGSIQDLSNFPDDARHIVVLVDGASEDAVSEGTIEVQVNDAASVHHDQTLTGTNTTAAGARGSSQATMTLGVVPGSSVHASALGSGWLLFPHAFGTTNHKAAIAQSGAAENSVHVNAGRAAVTAAITHLNLTLSTGDWDAGTIVKLCVVDEDYAIPESENILTADGTFSFQGLPIGRGDLSFVGYLRSDRSAVSDEVIQSLNEDTTNSNYARQRIDASNTTVAAAAAADRVVGESPGDSAASLCFGAFVSTIQQHSLGANDPHTLALSGWHDLGGPDSGVQLYSGRRNNVAKVTRADFAPSTGTNFKAGSMMTSYFAPKFQVGYAEADADVSAFTFTLANLPIPPDVTDLRLNWYARTDRSAATEGVDLEFNADTTAANYDRQSLTADGSTVAAARSAAEQEIGEIPGNSATANIFGGGTALIQNYTSTTRHKSRLYVGGAGDDKLHIQSGRWENTAAITAIKVTPSAAANFMAGTIFELEALLPVDGESRALSEGLGLNGSPQVFVDWDNDGIFSQANDEITTDVREVTEIVTGRSFPSTQTGDAVAGRMRMVLDNSSGNYSPLNTFGVETGNIVPGRLVKVRMTCPFTRDFTMYLDTIVPRASIGTIPLADLVATGPIRKLNTEVNVELQKAARVQVAIAEVLDKVNFSATLRELNTSVITLTRWGPGKQSALSMIRQLEKSEDGFFYESLSDGGLVFEEQDHRLTAPHHTSQAVFSDAQTSGTVGYRVTGQSDVLKQVFTDLRAVVQVWPAAASVTDLVSHPHANTTGNAPTIAAAGGTRTFILSIESDPAIDHVDAWTTPTLGAGADIEVWSASNGTGTNLSTSDVGISVVKLDTEIKITLTNNHASLVGYITVCDIRGTSVARPSPVTVVAQDASSPFGLIQLPNTAVAQYMPDTITAQGILDSKLLITKTPTAQTRIGGNPRENLYSAHKWLRREISDRVAQVSTGSQTKLGVNTEMFIESLKFSFGRERQTFVELGLFDTAGTNETFIVGRSNLGAQTRVARS